MWTARFTKTNFNIMIFVSSILKQIEILWHERHMKGIIFVFNKQYEVKIGMRMNNRNVTIKTQIRQTNKI